MLVAAERKVLLEAAEAVRTKKRTLTGDLRRSNSQLTMKRTFHVEIGLGLDPLPHLFIRGSILFLLVRPLFPSSN